MAIQTPTVQTGLTPPARPGTDVPFGVNEVRLNGRQWLATCALVALIMALTPWLWERLERSDTGPDFRLPYQLSKDYWLYGRCLRQVAPAHPIILLGDSVVWGEYVSPDGTLSHFLNQESGVSNRFVNGGLNGLFPLAQEGLVSYYGQSLRRQKLILHCNVLWMTSPKADLGDQKEQSFNHSTLVPQFFPHIPSYRASAQDRCSALVENRLSFLAWVGHLQNAYFDQKSILNWTLEEDESNPPRYPNAYKNPLAQITMAVPSAPLDDPQRGPNSPRHRPWSANGQGPTRFDWVPLEASLQWGAFQRVLGTLRHRGNDVLVIVGPLNEHMIAEENRPTFERLRDGIASWLEQNQVPHVIPETLPSALYADASHPLTDGYALLARTLFASKDFQTWMNR